MSGKRAKTAFDHRLQAEVSKMKKPSGHTSVPAADSDQGNAPMASEVGEDRPAQALVPLEDDSVQVSLFLCILRPLSHLLVA